jgi:hypothetical protein
MPLLRKISIFILFVFFWCKAFTQEMTLSRVCENGNNNILTWIRPTTFCDNFISYAIYFREYKPSSPDPYALLTEIFTDPTTTYTHINANTTFGKKYEYKITLNYLCSSVAKSVDSKDLIADLIPPNPTVIDSISVDPITNVVYIAWYPNKTIDFSDYSVYNSGIEIKITKNLSYTDASNDPKLKAISYEITGYDSCGNKNSFGQNQHTTILLNSSIDTCKSIVSLNWSHYKGWDSISKYYIFRSINSGTFELIDSVSGKTNSYSNTNIPVQSVLAYFVRAIKDTSILTSSSSNSVNISSAKRGNIKNTYINYVSIENNQVEISIHFDSTQYIGKLNLYRSPLNQNSFGLVRSYNHSQIGILSNLIHSDNPFIEENWKYKVIAYDVCNIAVDSSQISGNILLQGENQGDKNLINWSKYFTWNTGVKSYVINRYLNNYNVAGSNPVEIKTLNQNDSFYIDFDPELVGKTACYYIKAEQNLGSIFSRIENSKSNVFCLEGNSSIYLPNALNLNGGQNSIFMIRGLNINTNNLYFEVFDRWGRSVIKMNDLSAGWAGVDKDGSELTQGLYFYVLKTTDTKGETINKNGGIYIFK